MAADIELDDDDIKATIAVGKLSVKQMRDLIRQMSRKKDKSDEEKDKEIAKADKEREELSDLHASSRGAAPEIPVTKDDLPESMHEAMESDDEESDEEEEVPAKKSKKGKK
jgi:hypothetical protein